MLGVLNGIDLKGMGYNSIDYAHVVTEAIKLGFADRERYYGYPRFVKVPIETLLSDAYAEKRRALVRPDRAWPQTPPMERSPVSPVNALRCRPWIRRRWARMTHHTSA